MRGHEGSSSVEVFGLNVLRQFYLPLVTVVQQLLLVVQQLLVGLGRVLVVWTLNDSIDWARLLAEPAVDALCHVNVVPRCPAGAVFPRFRLDRDGLRWADRFAELARNAALLSARVSKCEWWCRVYNSYVLPAPACRNNGGMGGGSDAVAPHRDFGGVLVSWTTVDTEEVWTTVPSECVLAPEPWTEWALLKRVEDGGWLSEEVVEGHRHPTSTIREEHRLG
jgi:hypothetical protein